MLMVILDSGFVAFGLWLGGVHSGGGFWWDSVFRVLGWVF